MQESRFDSLRHYEYVTQEKKQRIAKILGVLPSRYSYLRSPEIYRPRLSKEEVSAIAKLLRRDPAYVRDMYERAA